MNSRDTLADSCPEGTVGQDRESSLGEKPGQQTASDAVPATLTRSASVPGGNGDTGSVRSTVSRTYTGSSQVIPRRKRRGLLAQIVLVPEITDPKDYKPHIKRMLLAIVALAAMTSPMGSAIYLPALPDITSSFNTTTTLTNLTVAFYLVAMGVFPLWWSSASERLGRRSIYVCSFALYTVFCILCAEAKSVDMLIVMRVLAAGAGASAQAVGAGTLGDLYVPSERGRAMGYFYLGPLMGPLIAPIIGGALTEAFSWRATLWFLVIQSGLQFVLVTLFLPETMRPAKVAPMSRTRSESTISHLSRWQTFVILATGPLKVLQMFRYIPVTLAIIFASLTFVSVYIMNVSITYSFSKPPYNYSSLKIGLVYIGNSLGYLIGSIVGGRWSDRVFNREARKNNGVEVPESRFQENVWTGCILLPIGLLVYGWTVQYGENVFACLAGTFVFGIGIMLAFSSSTTFLVDATARKGASAVACQNVLRNCFAGAGTMFTLPLENAIGNGPLFSILAGVCILATGLLFVIKINGPRWRAEIEAKTQDQTSTST